jgi:CheY-specific phosphatase CheX
MRKFTENNQGNVGTIILAVATAVTLAVSILITYSILGGMDYASLDSGVADAIGEDANSTRVTNSTNSLISGVNTFFSISPIYLIVLVAVAIIGAVMGIMVINRR